MKVEPKMKKTKSCKLMCMLLVLAMLLGLFAGCAAGGGEATNPPATTEPTQSGGPDVTEPSGGEDTTEPTGTEPADPGATEPTVTDPSDATEPTDFTGPADVTEPSDPSDPADPTEPTPPVETEPGHEHEYDKTVTAATCTEDGFATYTCKSCGDSYIGELTPAIGHKYGEWATTEEPTEAAEGAAERTCSTCGAKETKVLDKLIPNHTHSYTGKVTKKATCSAEGVRTYTCSCGGSYTEAIAKTKHRINWRVKIANCYEAGYTTYYCEVCGYSYIGNHQEKTTHSFSNESLDPSCEHEGYMLYTCDYCSDSYKTNVVPALGHNYVETVVAPTCSEQGYTLYECTRCNKSYKDNYKDPVNHSYNVIATCEATLWIQSSVTYQCQYCSDKCTEYGDPLIGEEKDAFLREVADATIKYINQFRKEQGDTEAVKLPGLTQVAEYRAVQLQTNFEHSTADLREAYAYYQYGEWHDNTAYGGTQYWSANAKEAIGEGWWHSTADQMGYDIAYAFRNSPNHWAYVGSSEFPYIGIGVTYENRGWNDAKVCILQTSINYG